MLLQDDENFPLCPDAEAESVALASSHCRFVSVCSKKQFFLIPALGRSHGPWQTLFTHRAPFTGTIKTGSSLIRGIDEAGGAYTFNLVTAGIVARVTDASEA